MSEMRRIKVNEFVFDERVNRAIVPGHLAELNREFNLDDIGIVTASQRLDGSLVLLDGQHRIRVLLDACLHDYEVRCEVFKGLTLDQEARKFRRLNKHRKTSIVDDYLKGVTARDAECVAIDGIVNAHGLRVVLQKGPGRIACVAALQNVYRGGRRFAAPALNGDGHPRELEDALSTAIAAWGRTPEAVEGHIVSGLGRVFLRHGGQVDRTALVKKLGKFPGGPTALVGRGKGIRDLRGGSVADGVAQIVVDAYNRGRRDPLV